MSRRYGVVRDVQLMTKDPSEPTRPHVYLADVANHGYSPRSAFTPLGCSGKGSTHESARLRCLGEAVERYSATTASVGDLIPRRRGELAGPSLDPMRLVLFHPDQYAELPYVPYSDDVALPWTQAMSLVHEQSIWVPTNAVDLMDRTTLPEQNILAATSNGLATGDSPAAAALGAICEVLERDAYLVAWLNELTGRPVDPLGHPDADVRELCRAYERRGVDVRLARLPTDHPCAVFVAIGVQTGGFGGPAAVVGLGADLDARRAAKQAVLEVAQVRCGLRPTIRRPEMSARVDELAAHPERVTTLEDHALLYCHPDARAALDVFTRGEPLLEPWDDDTVETPEDGLQLLVEHFRARGQDVLSVDLTPPDMERLGLFTARAILPDFQPIHFGRNERRLGGERLYRLPMELGLRTEPSTPDTLNDWPHPIG